VFAAHSLITAKPLKKCAVDAVVSGTVCIDKYEASVWRVPCANGGQNCTDDIYAVSLPGMTPSRFVTWFQAQAACENARKQLPAALLRGGDFTFGTNAGPFAVGATDGPSRAGGSDGFRCARWDAGAFRFQSARRESGRRRCWSASTVRKNSSSVGRRCRRSSAPSSGRRRSVPRSRPPAAEGGYGGARSRSRHGRRLGPSATRGPGSRPPGARDEGGAASIIGDWPWSSVAQPFLAKRGDTLELGILVYEDCLVSPGGRPRQPSPGRGSPSAS